MAFLPEDRDADGRICVTNVIGGKNIVLDPAHSFPVTSALLGKTVHHAQSATADLANAAIQSAANTFQTYRLSLVNERRKWLLRAAELFEEYRKDAVQRQISETSCAEVWADMNVTWVVEALQECAATVSTALVGELPPSTHGSIPLVYKVPVGVVLIIPP